MLEKLNGARRTSQRSRSDASLYDLYRAHEKHLDRPKVGLEVKFSGRIFDSSLAGEREKFSVQMHEQLDAVAVKLSHLQGLKDRVEPVIVIDTNLQSRIDAYKQEKKIPLNVIASQYILERVRESLADNQLWYDFNKKRSIKEPENTFVQGKLQEYQKNIKDDADCISDLEKVIEVRTRYEGVLLEQLKGLAQPWQDTYDMINVLDQSRQQLHARWDSVSQAHLHTDLSSQEYAKEQATFIRTEQKINLYREAAVQHLSKLEQKIAVTYEQLMRNSDQLGTSKNEYVHDNLTPAYDAQKDGFVVCKGKFAIGCVPGSVRMLASDHFPKYNQSDWDTSFVHLFNHSTDHMGFNSTLEKGTPLSEVVRVLDSIKHPFVYTLNEQSKLEDELAQFERQDDQGRSLALVTGLYRPFDPSHGRHALVLNGSIEHEGLTYLKTRDPDGSRSYLFPLYLYKLLRTGDAVLPGDRRVEVPQEKIVYSVEKIMYQWPEE